MKRQVLRPESLSDDALLARLDELVARGRRNDAELVWHLAEVDARKLYLREACPSMYVYATSRLHLSEAEAYLRITVARISRRFPVVLGMLADGRLHLSAIAKLSPHLRDEDGEALLARAVHRSKREIEELIADVAPKPDAPSLIRRLPAARGQNGAAGSAELRLDGVGSATTCGAPSAPHSGAAVEPTSVGRYKVQFTAGTELHDKITRAQALLRHQISDGDLAAVFDRAMTLLVRELERARFAAAKSPRKTADQADPTPSSRRNPDPIRRAVWMRDGGQCTFRDRRGRRCPAQERLQFHHLVPFARGGDHAERNVTLRCSAHNLYQAVLDFGADAMAGYQRGRPSA
jgi:hypothetical protein